MPELLEEIIRSPKVMLSMKTVGQIMSIHPSRLNEYARTGQLPFPVIRSGNRWKVPRIAFLQWGGWLK